MADNNASSNEVKAAREIAEMLDERVAKLNKSFKLGAIVGVVIAAFVIIYLSVLHSSFEEAIEPEALADVVTSEVSQRLPEITGEMEKALKDMAPEFVASIKTTVIEQSVPAVRGMMQEQVFQFADEFVNNSKSVLNEQIYSSMVNYNRELLAEAIKDDGPNTDKKAVELEKKMIAAMTTSLASEGKDQVNTELAQSLGALDEIKDRLDSLSKKKNLTRKERLMKKLISRWWTLLDTDKDKVSKDDMKELTKTLDKSTAEMFEGTKEIIQQEAQ